MDLAWLYNAGREGYGYDGVKKFPAGKLSSTQRQ